MKTEFRGVVGSKLEFKPDLKLFISGTFMYTDYEEIDCYDKNGNFIMKHTKEMPYSKKDSGFVESVYGELSVIETVFQRDFQFYKVLMFPYSRQEDLCKYWFYNNRYSVDYIPEDKSLWHNKDNKEAYKYAENKEMCLLGTQRYSIFHTIVKSLLSFNYQEYKLNKDNFIKNNADMFNEGTFQIDHLFNKNLQIVADYFMCDVDYLKSNRFCLKTQIMKRLMYKINQKELQMFYDKKRR